jgi:hypothetical protein
VNRHDRELSDVLQSIRAEDAGLASSSRVETQLRAEVAGVARARRGRLMAAALGVAALLTVVAVVSWRVRTGGQASINGAASATTSRPEMVTTFFPLTYSNLPVSNAQLIRVRVPRSALASFGLAPIDVPAAAGGGEQATVPADVLVGEDGVARAIRFVSP